MIFLKTYESFRVDEPSTMSELLEKLSVVEKNLLQSIGADQLNLDAFISQNINDLSDIKNNADIISAFGAKRLNIGNVEHTDDYETFLLSPFKFCLIHRDGTTDLNDPEYILIQTYNSTERTWNKVRIFKINGDFSNFYDKLSNRSIELSDGENSYIYQTSNKNQWDLVNREASEEFPKKLRKEELLKLINRK